MTDTPIPKHPGGRPAYIPNEATAKQVKTLAAMGMPHVDIGRVVGVSSPVLRRHYRKELDQGEADANAQVAQSLFKQATDKEKPNVVAAIFWLKCRANWKDHDNIGKKEQRALDAKKTASSGLYAVPPAPPRLVINNK